MTELRPLGESTRTDVVRPGLQDRFGRVIDYLRLSITDRCNLRCTYCMPLDRPDHAESSNVLTTDELELIVRAATSLGFRKFRLTGGEPTVRPDVLEVVRRIAAVPGVEDLAMTTNAVRLSDLAQPLVDAGLGRVNVHVDTLSAETLPGLMRRGSLDAILAGIDAAERAGLTPIKLNVVVVKGQNEHEVAELAAVTHERPWHVRFIELMPLGSSIEATYAVEKYVSNVLTRSRIEEALGPLMAVDRTNPSDESDNFRFSGAPGVVGFISPVSRPFCGGCNRMRLTSDGRFHLCLLRDEDLDVRTAIRTAKTPDAAFDAARRVLTNAVLGKPTGHDLDRGRHTKGRRMHQIGG